MQRKLGLSVLVVVGVLAAATSGVVLATSSDYDISIVGGIETPTETVDIANDEYEIDEVGVIEPGDATAFDVTSPDSYDVLLYTTDRDVENTVGGVSSDQFTIGDGGDLDTSALEPGTYMLSLEPDGEGRQAVAPVVKQGYDLSLSSPSTVEVDSEVTFEATAEPLDGMDRADEVTIVIWDGEDETEITLERTDGTTYEATQSLALEPGTYDVYGAVPGDDEVEGYSTVLAVSDGSELTVTDSADEPNDGNDGDDNGENDEDESGDTIGGGSDDGADDGNESDDGTDEKTDSDADNETAEPDESDEMTGSEENGTTETDGDDPETDDGDDVDDSADENTVIEPNDADETEQTDADETEDDGLGTPAAIPGVIALAGFLLTVAVRMRR